MKQDDLEFLQELIQNNQHFLITTHVMPDGDGLGSEMALKHFLQDFGKEVLVVNQDPAAERYHFIDSDREILVYDEVKERVDFNRFQVFFVLDTSLEVRLGKMAGFLKLPNLRVVTLDHHASSSGKLGERCIMDRHACSIGEMIYDLIRFFGVSMDIRIATPLYISIVTDTGNFRYPNTTVRAHEIAAEIIRLGVNPGVINSAVFENLRENQVRMLGESLQQLQTACRGRIIWTAVTRTMLDRYNVLTSDLYFFIDYLKTIQSGEIIAIFKEIRPDYVEVSLRSKNPAIDVSMIADKLGGGGHKAASGIILECSIEQAQADVLAVMEQEIHRVETLKLQTLLRNGVPVP